MLGQRLGTVRRVVTAILVVRVDESERRVPGQE